MKNLFKRLFALLLVLTMVGSMLPNMAAESYSEPEAEATVISDEAYAALDNLFAQIDEMEASPAKKNATTSTLSEAAEKLVLASEHYVEGSLDRNGDAFTWMTDVGVRCGYNPRMRAIRENMVAPATPEETGAVNEPVAKKGGWPSSNQVYLIGPYYNSDENFTDQYKNEAAAIASAIGDTDGYTLYADNAATIDNIAKAISNGAVVIFDSHGSTDYARETGDYYDNGDPVYECVSGANYSYICLSTKSGLTDADYADGAIWDGYDAFVSGDAIANHMTSNSPGGLLWMAICLGMATDSMCGAMREKGVEVVYGYSQSVTFLGDYKFEETFWDNMCSGTDVATAIAAMKSKWGNWDWSTQIAKAYGYSDGYSDISSARTDWCAFPIVVSDEDAHPGQRNDLQSNVWGACSLQTVKSTYTLFSQYTVTAQSNNTSYGTVSVNGSTITATPAAGYFAESATVTSGTATVTQNGNTFSVAAESDCTVQINFAAKTPVTVNFSGANVSGLTGYSGDAMALPFAEAPEGYSFVGWTTAPLSSDTTEEPNFYTDSFIPNANTTLYALYSYVDASADGGSGDYVKVTSTPADWSGEYLLVYENGSNAYIFNGTDAVNDYISAPITNDTVASNATTDEEAVTIEPMSGGYAIKTKNGYIYGTSGSNKLNFNTSTQQLNTLSLSADGSVLITSNTSVLRFNNTSGQYRFRYYKAASYSSQQPVYLYVKDGSAGVTYYTSSLCDHETVTNVAAVAPTCTETGFTAGTQCTECGSYVTGHEVVAALGHDWSDWAVTDQPTCDAEGEEERTCANCGEIETQTVAATGHNVGEGVVTTPATCTEEGVMSYTCADCGDTTTEAIPATGHSYADGVCSGCGEAEPEVAGYYIAAIRSSGNYFYMSGNLTTTSTKRYQAVNSGLTVLPESISNPEADKIFLIIDNGDGTCSLQAQGIEGNNYLGWTSGNSGALVAEASALKLTMVDNGDGSVSFKFNNGTEDRFLSLNGTTGTDYFAWYKSGQVSKLYLIPVGGTAAPEVTEPVVTEPAATEPEATEPVATEPEASEPASVTALQYVFSNYAAGTQYAKGEDHMLDDVVTLTINGAHLNGSIRLYAGSNAVFASTKEIDSIVVNAGNKAGTLSVYASADGNTWELVATQATTASYVNYTFDIPAGNTYVKLEAAGGQIRVPQMTINVLSSGSAEPDVTEPEGSEPEVTEPDVTEPEATEPAGTATGVEMVTAPVANTAYKLYLNQTTLGKTLYFAGTVANQAYYLATTEDVNAAVDVYLEETEGGCYLYFMANGVKTYIDMYQSGNYYNLRLATEPSVVYSFYAEYNTLMALNGDLNCFIGTHSSYNTMSCCKETYLTSNFVAHLGIPTDAPVEPEATEPAVTEPEATEPEATEPEGSEPVVGSSATISFATLDQRTEFSTEAQVWQNAGATLTNNKGASSSAVANYSNPVRFYKNSDIIVSFPGMVKMEFTCSSADYATALKNSISDANVTVTVSGMVVTVELAEAADEYTITLSGGQVRMKELTVYAAASSEACVHTNTTTTTVDSTCTAHGSVTVTCNDCGETVSTEELPLADHSYDEGVVTAPTTTTGGYTTYTCTACGHSYQDNIKNPLPAELKFRTWSLTLKSDLTVNFQVEAAVYNAYENMRAEFTIVDGVEEHETVVVTEAVLLSNGRYSFQFAGVAPYRLKDTIQAKLYGIFEGVEYVIEKEYQVVKYCQALMPTGGVVGTVAVNLVNFATMQQIYMSHNTNDLINSDLTDDQKAMGTYGKPTWENKLTTKHVVIDNPTAAFKGVTLDVQSIIRMRFTVELPADTTGIVAYITADNGAVLEVPFEEFEPTATANRYYIYFSGMRAVDMRKCAYVCIKQNGTVISNTLRYSIESYCATSYVALTNLGNLLEAMINYGDAVEKY